MCQCFASFEQDDVAVLRLALAEVCHGRLCLSVCYGLALYIECWGKVSDLSQAFSDACLITWWDERRAALRTALLVLQRFHLRGDALMLAVLRCVRLCLASLTRRPLPFLISLSSQV